MDILIVDENDETWTVEIVGLDPSPHPTVVEKEPEVLGHFISNVVQLKDYTDENMEWALHQARLVKMETDKQVDAMMESPEWSGRPQ